MTTTARPTLVQELDALHASYVEAINMAVSEDDVVRADELAAAYDSDATTLMAEREGRTHLLPLQRPVADSRLRRLLAQVTGSRAA